MLLDASDVRDDGTHKHSGAVHITKITCPMSIGGHKGRYVTCMGYQCAAFRPVFPMADAAHDNHGLGHCGVGGGSP